MAPADWERRHAGQVESWTFDFWAPAAGVPALAGFVGFAFLPGRAWCWAALVGTGRPYLLVRDLDLDPPRRPGSRQLRGSLWADANCETPHEHWSVGLEAYGVELDDPDDALRGERGVRTGLGIDLEWEADGPPIGAAGDYAAAARVHGEVLVGAGRDVETIAVDGAGLWRHRWDELASVTPVGLTLATVPARVAADGDPWASMAAAPQSLEPLLDLHRADMAAGLLDAPWPPVYPKMPNEPPRVAPSRARKPEGGQAAR